MPEAQKAPKKDKKNKAPKADKPKVDKPKVARGKGTPRGEGQYEATGTYNPKAAKNLESYNAVVAVLPATLPEIEKAIPEHTNFVGYLIRRGGIAEQ